VSTLATRDWVPTQWLSQVLMAGFEEVFGLPGVAWLSGFTFVTYVAVLWWACRARAGVLVAALVTAVAFLASAQGLSARPQLASYILTVVTLHVWLRTAEDHKVRWWLVPLTWLWAMLYGMWPVGIILGLVAVAGVALDNRDLRWARRALLVPLGSLVAAALTPAEPRLVTEVLLVSSRGAVFGSGGRRTTSRSSRWRWRRSSR